MKGFVGLTKRNLLIFFKDRQSVIFSLLTSMIVLALYLLFLKGTFTDTINSSVESFNIPPEAMPEGDIDMLVNLMLLSGIVGSAMITVSYNCLTTVVKDRENKVDRDILATPLKRKYIIMSYFVAAALSSVILTGIILTAGFIVMGSMGKMYLEPSDVLAAYGIVVLGSVSATALFMIPALLFKTTGASGAFFGLISAASGFVIGAYIPISTFSEGVQTVCNLFPASQVTIMLRNVLMRGVLEHADEALGGAFSDAVKDIFSFKANVFGKELGIPHMLIYVTACLAACLVIQIVIYSRSYRRK